MLYGQSERVKEVEFSEKPQLRIVTPPCLLSLPQAEREHGKRRGEGRSTDLLGLSQSQVGNTTQQQNKQDTSSRMPFSPECSGRTF